MKASQFDQLNLSSLTESEMREISGGFISYLSIAGPFRLLGKGIQFVAGEIYDFGSGVWDGIKAGFN
ncbi:MAG: hypothetical protein HOP08_05830 [Cyclobacteriaceae bacterium]|nr:hypothetical protein [Cyclobacteriaceae bacterium]